MLTQFCYIANAGNLFTLTKLCINIGFHMLYCLWRFWLSEFQGMFFCRYKNEKEKKDQLLMMAVFMEYNPKISLKFCWRIAHVDTRSLKKSGLKRSWFNRLLSKKCLKFYCYDLTFSHDTYTCIWQPASTQKSSLNSIKNLKVKDCDHGIFYTS